MSTPEEVWQAYQDIFSTPIGQIVLKDLENAHYYRRSTASEGGIQDGLKLAMREGERNVVLRIHTIIRTTPNQITSE